MKQTVKLQRVLLQQGKYYENDERTSAYCILERCDKSYEAL